MRATLDCFTLLFNICLCSLFIEHCTKELKKYFGSFESKFKEGMFEELSDVCLFRHVGVDSNGLDLLIRLRGSNICNNVHQKMKKCVGRWHIGVEKSFFISSTLLQIQH